MTQGFVRYNPEVVVDDGKDVFASMIETPDGAWVRFDTLHATSRVMLHLFDQAAGIAGALGDPERVRHANILRDMIADLGAGKTREIFTADERRYLRHFVYRLLGLVGASLLLGLLIGWLIWGRA